MPMLENMTQFSELWLKNVYLTMSPQFKKMINYDDIRQGIKFRGGVGIDNAFNLSRYAYGKKLKCYPQTLGLIAAEAIERLDPMNLMIDMEDVGEDIREHYWEQLAALRYFVSFQSKEVEKYTLEYVKPFIYAQEIMLMNFGKQLCMAYDDGNCLPNNLSIVSLSYVFIGSAINYLWVLSQLEPLETIDKGILQNQTVKEIKNVRRKSRASAGTTA